MRRAAPWVLAVASALMLRSVWPRTVEVISPPRIRTVYDTVIRLDTVAITKTLRRTDWDTVYLERVTVTAPETVYVSLPQMYGLTFLSVPDKPGDSTIARGFELGWQDSALARRAWETQWYTPGPLQVLSLDTFPPRVAFGTFAPAVKPCRFFCKLSHYAVGAAFGAALWEVVR